MQKSHSTISLTISSAQTLVDTLGYFGGERQDTKNNSAYFTHMVAISDFPEGYDPGCFFILFLGVFISLKILPRLTFVSCGCMEALLLPEKIWLNGLIEL